MRVRTRCVQSICIWESALQRDGTLATSCAFSAFDADVKAQAEETLRYGNRDTRNACGSDERGEPVSTAWGFALR